jgi:hypothetical protein
VKWLEQILTLALLRHHTTKNAGRRQKGIIDLGFEKKHGTSFFQLPRLRNLNYFLKKHFLFDRLTKIAYSKSQGPRIQKERRPHNLTMQTKARFKQLIP